DAAANGTTVGWQLAINVAAMLITFIALLAMVNLGVGWLGGFFRNPNGLIQFNLIAISVLVSLFAIEKYGPPRDTPVWWALPAVGVLYVAARSVLGPDLGRLIGLIGSAVCFILSERCRTCGRKERLGNDSGNCSGGGCRVPAVRAACRRCPALASRYSWFSSLAGGLCDGNTGERLFRGRKISW